MSLHRLAVITLTLLHILPVTLFSAFLLPGTAMEQVANALLKVSL